MPRSRSDTSPVPRRRFQIGPRAGPAIAAGALVLASLGGCDRIRTVARKVALPAAAAPEYLAPPAPAGSSLQADGRIAVQGSAPAGSKVSLRSPEGDSAEASVDADGRWSVSLPASKTPRLYAFDAALDGRTIRAEGALCVLPSGAVLVLRAGSGAAVLGSFSGLALADVDFDGGGGVAASGLTLPNTPVRLTIDGAAAGVGQSDARGHFGVMGLDPRRAPTSGEHSIGVQSPAGPPVSAKVSLSPAKPLASNEIYRAAPAPGGWRIDWRLPGGGTQTAVVFSPVISAAAGVQ